MNLFRQKATASIDISTPEKAAEFMERFSFVSSFFTNCRGELLFCHQNLRSFIGREFGGDNDIHPTKIEVLLNDSKTLMLRVTWPQNDKAILLVEEK